MVKLRLAFPFITAVAAATGPNTGSTSYPGSCGALQTTYDTCVSNALYSSTTGLYADDIFSFCQSIQQLGQQQYYQCLCDRTTAILLCFDQACSSDSQNRAIPANQRIQYCTVESATSSTAVQKSAPTSVPTTKTTEVAATTSSKSGASSLFPGYVLASLGFAVLFY